MSDSTPPPRRRRIAGESARPGAKKSAGKPVARKPVARKKQTPESERPAPRPSAATGSSPKTERSSAIPRFSTSAPRATRNSDSSVPQRAKVAVAAPSIRMAPRPSAPSGSRDIVALIVAALLLVAGVVVLVAGVNHVRADGYGESRAAATEAAADAAQKVLSYNSDEFDAYRESIRAVVTEQYYDDTVADLEAGTQVKTAARVRHTAVVPCGQSCNADEAQVLVFVDLDRQIQGGEVSTFANRIVLNMVRVDGDWKVSDIEGR